MAEKAKRPDIRQVACSAALHDRHNMIGVPQRAAIDGLQSPLLKHPHAAGSSAALQGQVCCDCIRSARGADSLVPGESLLAQKAGIRP